MRTATAIVAHTTRMLDACDLARNLDASIVLDAGQYGPGVNHLRAWALLAADPHADWLIAIEDDAIPCVDFEHQLAALLPTAPTPVVSLYLGTGHPAHLVRHAARMQAQAEARGDDWLTLPTMNHAVAVCIRADLAADMLTHLDGVDWRRLAVDEAIGSWTRDRGHEVSYPTLSLVDHRDDTSLIAHPDGRPRTRPRHAIRFADA